MQEQTGPRLGRRPEKVVCFGGGHGLFQTLRAMRHEEIPDITAVVTVADDGGSSGRIRMELGQLPPGDLRMALAALTPDTPAGVQFETLLQHRFGGIGALAGHAMGNLLLAGLAEISGCYVTALNQVAQFIGAKGKVLPMATEPLEIEADVAGIGDDPRAMQVVKGQVAVATTVGSVRRVRLVPHDPAITPAVLDAIAAADLITLGPGSWFTSVIPHVLVPEIVAALNESRALKTLIVNLSAEPGETAGFSTERHVQTLVQHAPSLRIDRVLVNEETITGSLERQYLAKAAALLGAEVVYAPVAKKRRVYRTKYDYQHDPAALGAALVKLAQNS